MTTKNGNSRLQDKVAIVTGGASGIGKATAELFAGQGAKVVIADIQDAAGEAVAQDIRERGGEALFQHTDVTKAGECEKLVAETISAFGRLDILVNSAGTSIPKTLVDHSEEEWDFVMNLNLKAVYLTCKYAILEMLKHGGGSIVNIASTAGIVGRPLRGAYCPSNGGRIMLTRQAALDYAPHGIRINVICPGSVDTPLRRRLAADTGDGEAHLAIHPIGRIGQPREIAEAALFLASDEASFITGAVLPVDGGHTMQ